MGGGTQHAFTNKVLFSSKKGSQRRVWWPNPFITSHKKTGNWNKNNNTRTKEDNLHGWENGDKSCARIPLCLMQPTPTPHFHHPTWHQKQKISVDEKNSFMVNLESWGHNMWKYAHKCKFPAFHCAKEHILCRRPAFPPSVCNTDRWVCTQRHDDRFQKKSALRKSSTEMRVCRVGGGDHTGGVRGGDLDVIGRHLPHEAVHQANAVLARLEGRSQSEWRIDD